MAQDNGGPVRDWRAEVDDLVARARRALDQVLPPVTTPPARIHEAMRYSALAGGKVLRPLLLMAAARCVGGPRAVTPAVERAAAAVELVHTYSLIHDDLPAMDDDDLRRGRPTLHRAFDEATAILAGDALQPLAFAWLAEAPFAPEVRVEMVDALARAAGPAGLVGGQQLDLDPAGVPSLEALLELEAMKTGALFLASVRLGALAAGVRPGGGGRLERFARRLGLLFQVTDDLLDAARGEPSSAVTLAGEEAARRLADRLAEEALGALDGYAGEAARRLRELVALVRNRRL